jgi:hypothetical protein
MALRDWIIITAAIAATPVWAYSVFNQWSKRPGSTQRMLASCGVFVVIIASGMLAAYLAT